MEYASEYAKNGHRLYQILILPVEDYLSERTVLIVDKVLGYVPFDLLLTELPTSELRFRDHAYLLHDHAISYCYSTRQWMDMHSRHTPVAPRLLGMAPVFPGDPTKTNPLTLRSGLSQLNYNIIEVQDVSTVVNGAIFTGADATKDNFVNYCSHYGIIHLATHSKANDAQGDFSFLAFAGEEKLFTGEIYNLRLNAELVTLSACETGLGELQSGEGIISLARAFSFAGAKSILSSLWSVNDVSTPTLMKTFYQNIKAGLPRDVALQHAKLEFLNSHGHVDAHPFFWGGFICVGDMHPIQLNTYLIKRPATWIIATVLIVIALVLYRRFY